MNEISSKIGATYVELFTLAHCAQVIKQDVHLVVFLLQGSISELAKELIPSITRLLIDEEKPQP